jgi:hypothetical protein
MYLHISNKALLWALGFIDSTPSVAVQCAAALALHHGLLPESEALVLLHQLDSIRLFLRRRIEELRMDHVVEIRSDGPGVHLPIVVRYKHEHGVAEWPARIVEREYTADEARALLKTLLSATESNVVSTLCNVFGVAPGSPLVMGDVLEAIDSRESRSWYGADRNAPRPRERWVIERPWSHSATLRRLPDGFRRSSQTDILLDKRVWRLIGVVRNVVAIATMGGKDAPTLDVILTERKDT